MACTFNDNCPAEAVAEVTVVNNTTVFNLTEDGSGRIALYEEQGFSGQDFYLPNDPIAEFAMSVFVNGLLQSSGTNYVLGADPKLIRFTSVLDGDDVQVRYATTDTTADVSAPVQVLRHALVLTGTEVVLPYEPSGSFPVVVYVNGVLQAEGGDYSRVTDTITFTSTLSSAVVQVLYSID